jgi:hypothetical protein
MGQFEFTEIDHRTSGFLSDKWTVGKKLTLNLGARYDRNARHAGLMRSWRTTRGRRSWGSVCCSNQAPGPRSQPSLPSAEPGLRM